MEKALPPAIIAAGIGAAGALGGGLMASSGASKAAKIQQQAQQQAIAAQQAQQQQTRADFEPFRQAGLGGLAGYGDLVGTNGSANQGSAIQALQNSPLYQSLYRNGLEATLQNASATGGIRGGNTQDALARFGSDTLSQTIQNQLGNLGGLASLGEGATYQGANLGQQGANNISSLTQQGGQDQASYATAQAGIMSGMFKNIAGFAQYAAAPPVPTSSVGNAFGGGGINVSNGTNSYFGSHPFGGF